jgi:hypothetical protein
MPSFSYLRPDHEAGDVLQEHQRHLALAAQLDEVRALHARSREQDAVVGDDAHRHALDVREAGDQRGAEAGLELVELAAVDDARDDLAHVEGLARVGRDHAVQLARHRTAARAAASGAPSGCLRPVEVATARASASACVSSDGQVVGHAGQARVHVAAAQVLGADTSPWPPSPAAGRPGRSCPAPSR